jgi:hypothetical protein
MFVPITTAVGIKTFLSICYANLLYRAPPNHPVFKPIKFIFAAYARTISDK